MPVFAEGRGQHQKQNQTATSQWPVGFVFGVQLDYSCRKKSEPAYAENRVHGVLSNFLPQTLPSTRFSPSGDTLFNRHE